MSKATTKKPKQPKQKAPEGLSIVNLHAAGIDVSATSHMVALPAGSAEPCVREFGAFTHELHELAQWLKDAQITTVALESTGVYWKPLHSVLLHYGFEVYLVNARHVKNVTGKKTDQSDAQWIQKLHACALLNSSFLPDEQSEKLRTLVRHRNKLMADASRYTLRIQKALELMNIKVHSVLSKLMGKSGRQILEAIIGGETDPEKFLTYIDRRVKADAETIKASLNGYWKAEELFLVQQNYTLYKGVEQCIESCDEKIRELLAKQCQAIEVPMLAEQQAQQRPSAETKACTKNSRQSKKPQGKPKSKNQPKYKIADYLQRIHGVDVTKVYGISDTTALRIYSETGGDLSKWESQDKFVSWLRLCPNNKVSAGKLISSQVMKGKAGYASQAFRQAANSLSKSDHWLGDYFRRMRSKGGNKYAIIAVARKLAIIYYKMVRYKQVFMAVDVDVYRQKHQAAKIKYLEKQLAKLKGVA